MTYESQIFKVPEESKDYQKSSDFVTSSIEAIIKDAVDAGENKIVINTNLKSGLPMENINKIAGPFIEAWAFQTFYELSQNKYNKYQLINAKAVKRLHMADVILHFRKNSRIESVITSEVDVKATAGDIENSGKSPNITSFARIRTAYVKDPDYIFIILSLKHKVYSTRNDETNLMDGIMEIVGYNAYDLKYLSPEDISYNPALGTGQIQVRDIHYVNLQLRTTWEFCQLLDRKYLNSQRRDFAQWLTLARKNKWIKEDV